MAARRTTSRAKMSIPMYLACVLLCLTLAFIWGNSLMGAELSGSLSQWLAKLLGFTEPGPAGEPVVTDGLLRKLAHVCEFGFLGFLLSWLARMTRQTPRAHWLAPIVTGFLCACADETIQLFMPDRGGSLFDVWLDFSGYMTGVACFNAIYAVIHRKKA